MRTDGQRIALAAFIAEAVLAGGNAVGVRFSNRELDPLWGASLRFGLAAALLGAVMVATRVPLPRGRALGGALLYGALTFGGAFALAYYALDHIHAGLGQTLLALVPLATLMVAVGAGQERLTPGAIAGALIALAGIAVISRPSGGEAIDVLPLLASLGAVLCFALATVLVRGFPPAHPVAVNAVGMCAGAALLLIGAVFAGDAIEMPERAETWRAIAYLVVVGSGVVFVLYVLVLRYWDASRAAYGFVLTPVVTVLLSAWLDDEPIGTGLVLGGVLVLAGVYVGALRSSKPPPAPAEQPV